MRYIPFIQGYNNQCPILSTISDIEGKINNETTDLYRLMFPITDYEPTIAVVGLFGVPGGVAGVSEMQTRYICNVFKVYINFILSNFYLVCTSCGFMSEKDIVAQ